MVHLRNVLLLLIAAGFSSCLKNDFDPNAPRYLTITFNNQGLSASDVDSVVFVLNVYDTTGFASKPLSLSGNQYSLDISTLPTGYYYMGEIAVYAKPDSLGVKYQYYYPLQFDPQIVSAITLPAPPGTGTGAWFKRIILEDEEKKVAAMIPLRVVDPYFEIKAESPYWIKISVERDLYYHMDNYETHAGSAKFECVGNCFINGTGRLVNRTAFQNFAASNSSAIWNRASAKFTIANNNPDETIVLEHEWSR
jgi:hypothetical protein